jgi:hypothetical protein
MPRSVSGLALVPFKLFAARTGAGTGASACALCDAGTYFSSAGASGWCHNLMHATPIKSIKPTKVVNNRPMS